MSDLRSARGFPFASGDRPERFSKAAAASEKISFRFRGQVVNKPILDYVYQIRPSGEVG